MIKKILRWLMKMLLGLLWVGFGAVNISAGIALIGKKNL